jgi:hypothetical protein
VLLADDLVEGARPESDGQRRLRGEPLGGSVGEEVLGDPATLPPGFRPRP